MFRIANSVGIVIAVILVVSCWPNRAAASGICGNLSDVDVTIHALNLQAAGKRVVPTDVLHPASPGKYPLIIFSHGAFASPHRYRALLIPVAKAGFIVIAPRHLDSEDWERETRPSQSAVWQTRTEDMVIIRTPNPKISRQLQQAGIEIDFSNIAAMGHSYGALIAQIAGGAKPNIPSSLTDHAPVQAVVAFSPPGVTSGLIGPEGWSTLRVPNLTITGTADILPGFIDDWQIHKHGHEHAPAGQRWLWAGDGVDHYFGGMIGRQKPASKIMATMFDRAVATTLAFLDHALNSTIACTLTPPLGGEALQRDGTEHD